MVRGQAPPGTSRTLSRFRRTLFGALMLVIVYAVTEFLSLGAYRLAFGTWFSFAALDAERRHFAASVFRFDRPDYMAQCVIHPYLGWVINPDAANAGDPHFSSHGFYKLGEPIQRRSPGKVIVGITGGSVAYLFCNNGIPALRKALADSPRYADRELVFINLAQGGYKQPQQLMTLNYFLAQGAEFDVLVNIDGFNEIALYDVFNADHHVCPIYPPNWHLLCNVPDPALTRRIGRLTVEEDRRRTWARRCAHLPWRYSVTVNFLWKVFDQRLEQTITKHQSEIQSCKQSFSYQALGPGNTLPSKDATDGELIAVWKRCSLQLDRLCRANRIAYYQFLQPNQYVADSKPMGLEENRVARIDHHAYRSCVERCYPRLIAEGVSLRQQGVHFRDLTMIFANHPEPLYADWCCHFNQQGNEIMAQVIADTLLETEEPPLASPTTD